MFSRAYQVLNDVASRFSLVFTSCFPIFRNQANSKYATWQLSVLRIFCCENSTAGSQADCLV